ncbi:hypothetical protein Tco_0213472 [Tanacetum coccineum]
MMTHHSDTRLEPRVIRKVQGGRLFSGKEEETTKDNGGGTRIRIHKCRCYQYCFHLSMLMMKNEIPDEFVELREKGKGKNVEKTRISPIPSPTRSPRNLSTLGRYGYLFAHLKKRFMPRTSSDQLVDNLHDVMVETLPSLVKEKVTEQVKKEVPRPSSRLNEVGKTQVPQTACRSSAEECNGSSTIIPLPLSFEGIVVVVVVVINSLGSCITTPFVLGLAIGLLELALIHTKLSSEGRLVLDDLDQRTLLAEQHKPPPSVDHLEMPFLLT